MHTSLVFSSSSDSSFFFFHDVTPYTRERFVLCTYYASLLLFLLFFVDYTHDGRRDRVGIAGIEAKICVALGIFWLYSSLRG